MSLSAWDGALPNRLQAWSPAGMWSFRDVESAATVTVPHEPRGEARGVDGLKPYTAAAHNKPARGGRGHGRAQKETKFHWHRKAVGIRMW